MMQWDGMGGTYRLAELARKASKGSQMVLFNKRAPESLSRGNPAGMSQFSNGMT